MVKLSQIWIVEGLSYWLLYPFICLHHFLNPSLLFGTKRYSGLIVLFLSLTPGNNHFSKESWLLLAEVVFRNQDLGTGYVDCYWDVVLAPQWSELRSTHAPYIYFSFYVKILNSHWSLILLVSVQLYWVNSSLTSFPICTDSEKPGCVTFNIFTYLFNPLYITCLQTALAYSFVQESAFYGPLPVQGCRPGVHIM